MELLTKINLSPIDVIGSDLDQIFSLHESKRIALTILFRFNNIADKRRFSVTDEMPHF